MSEKKPVYKKWWFWLIIVVIVIGVIGTGEEEPQQEIEEQATTEETVEDNKTTEVETAIAEYEDELLFGEYTVTNIKTEIKDNELKLMFNWINQSGEDDLPFTGVGYFDVTQGEDILK